MYAMVVITSKQRLYNIGHDVHTAVVRMDMVLTMAIGQADNHYLKDVANLHPSTHATIKLGMDGGNGLQGL